jgi:hypothetical protein
MTDPSKLMPGPELDAMVAEVLGKKPEMLCYDSPWQLVPCLEGTDCERDCAHLAGGGRSATCRSYQLSPVPQYSTDPTANADVERWLASMKPSIDAGLHRLYSDNIHSQCKTYISMQLWEASGHGLRWDVGYAFNDKDGLTNFWLSQGAFASETNSDPIAAEMLAVCRFAVRVARELKKVEGK